MSAPLPTPRFNEGDKVVHSHLMHTSGLVADRKEHLVTRVRCIPPADFGGGPGDPISYNLDGCCVPISEWMLAPAAETKQVPVKVAGMRQAAEVFYKTTYPAGFGV